jgi:CRP-like cAMP-binding protein
MVDLLQKIRDKYSYVPDDKFLEIISLGEIITLAEGDIFVKAGERTHKVGLLLQGMMRNYITNDNGEEVTVVFATEMQPVAAYSTTFLDRPATETSAAVEPSILFVIDFRELRQKIDGDPLLMRLYVETIETSFVAAIERIEDFTRKSPEERYRRLLDAHGFLIERAPLKYLASYLGITAVSLSRIRKRVSQKQ